MRKILVMLVLAGCSPPPEQPDLNTYGVLQPLCLFFCRVNTSLVEGDGAAGSITSTVTNSETATEE
jgi:hypothetical protein